MCVEPGWLPTFALKSVCGQKYKITISKKNVQVKWLTAFSICLSFIAVAMNSRDRYEI